MKNGNNHGFWYAFNLTAFILIVLFVVSIPLLHAFEQFAQTVDINASLEDTTANQFVPTSFTVDIKNASGTPLNAIEFELHYNPKEVSITKIVPHTTLCEERFIITNTIDNTSGTALFQCGTMTSFSGTTGTVATVYVTPLSVGTTSMAFGTTTHVLAHDGLGTDATRNISSLVFNTI